MPVTVNSNNSSLFAQRALGKNTFDLQKSIEKLSTGYRLNRAADDAAGLSISEKLTSEIKGLEKAKQNAGDGISMVQTAEGGLSVIQDNLQRIRELFVQGSNGTNGTAEKDAIQREVNERVKTIDAISQATKFNGNALLYGGTSKTLQVGADNGQTLSVVLTPGAANTGIDVDIAFVRTGGAGDYGQLMEGTTTASLSLDGLQISGATVASYDGSNVGGTVADLDSVIGNVSRMRSYLGAVQNSLESRIDFLDTAAENSSASRSRVKDADIAKESSNMLRSQILQQSAGSMLAQANSSPQVALSLLP